MQLKREKRDLNGFLLLNKEKGKTSNFYLQKVKYLYQAKKAGHTGALDPIATGMLPICFGRATKFANYLLGANKSYTLTAKLGIKTDTADITGDVIKQKKISLTKEKLLEDIEKIKLQTKQIPPIYSALKHQGVPLYKHARAGKAVVKAPRDIKIIALKLLSFQNDSFKLQAIVSKGTYIRTLIENLAALSENLSCMSDLERNYVEPYQGQKIHKLSDLENKTQDELDNYLIDIGSLFTDIKTINISADEHKKLKQGLALETKNAQNNQVKLECKNKFVGLGEINIAGILKQIKLI